MPRFKPYGSRPNWTDLCELAATQGGYFTAKQAGEFGYSRQLLDYHCSQGRLEKARRGMFRLSYYPYGDSDDLLLDWLWTERKGVVSHDSALALHGLSDILPRRRHLSVPLSWRHRRLRLPPGLVLHYGLPDETELDWYGAVRLTKPVQTLRDCAEDDLSPDLLLQAIERGLAEGRFQPDQVSEILREVGDR